MPSTSRIPYRLIAVLLVAGLAGYFVGTRPHRSALAASSSTTTTTSNNGIHVGATGKFSAVPDAVRLSISVEQRRSTPLSALSAANETLSRVYRALKRDKVSSRDLQTQNLSLNPAYDYSSNHPVLIGYTASESLNALLRNLKTAGKAIDDAVAAGGSAARIDNVSLDIADPSAYVKKAREDAFNDARDKATQYATLAGRHLGAMLSVTENVSVPQPYPVQYDQAFLASAHSAAAPVPIAPGTRDVTVTVQVVWALA